LRRYFKSKEYTTKYPYLEKSNGVKSGTAKMARDELSSYV
jgi:hypothetical protein